MFKNIGHFFAVIAHGVVIAAKATPAIIARVGTAAAEVQGAEQALEPTVNAIVGTFSPSSEAALQAMEHLFGDGCAAFVAAGSAAENGFSMSVSADAAQKIKGFLAAISGKK